MPACSVPRCSNRTKKDFKIFMARFPKDPERKKSWIVNIGKTNWEPTIHSFVCETHFANEMWEKVRVDGKRKLKCNAIPTIFPVPTGKNGIYITTNDQANESLGMELDAIETFHVNRNEKQNDCLESDIPNVVPSTSSNFTGLFNTCSYSKEKCNEEFHEIKWLKKQLEEANRKLDLANKLLLKSNQSSNKLKNHIKRLTKMKNKSKDRNYSKLESSMKQIFSDDQIEAITLRSTRGRMWSNDTIKKALRLKFSCGSSGYQELLKQNIPLPSERTLQRKLESIQFEEGICDDIFKLLGDKIAQFKDSLLYSIVNII